MNQQYLVLSTKKLKAPLKAEASLQGIIIREEEFIAIRPILTEEKHHEILRWVLHPEELYVVFTSQHAVEFAALHFEHDNTYYVTHQWQVCCLQGNTAQFVKKLLREKQIAVTGSNAAELAHNIIDKGNIQKVIFFCGNQRRDELPDLLRTHGIEVTEVMVYETQATPAVIDTAVNAILFFSPTGVNSFFSVNTLPTGIPCFAIGSTTAATIAKHTDNPIIISKEPSQEMMMQQLINHFKNINQ